MWDPEHPPWKSTARVLVLLRRGSDWRFAVYYAVDVADGRLEGVSPDTTPEEAQARLMSKVEAMTERRYLARWIEHDSDSWTAELSPVD